MFEPGILYKLDFSLSIDKMIRVMTILGIVLASIWHLSVSMALSTRERIRNFYLNHQSKCKLFTVNHFKSEGFDKSFIYKTIKKVEKGVSVSPTKKTGRPSKALTKNELRKLRSLCEGKIALSWVKLGKIFNMRDKTIKRTCEKYGLVRLKRKIIPKVSVLQAVTQRYRLKRLQFDLNNLHHGDDIIMDDETYMKITDSTHNKHYFPGSNGTSKSVKYIEKAKFERKVLVHITISPRGASAPLIVKNSKQNVDGAFYRDFVINGTLKSFVETHYPDGKYVFWPDLAAAHVSSDSLDEFARNNIPVVDIDSNPPSVPQLRPIETFWSHLKRRVYEEGWQAKSERDLSERIEKVIADFSPDYFSNLLKNVRKNISTAVRKGIDALN